VRVSTYVQTKLLGGTVGRARKDTGIGGKREQNLRQIRQRRRSTCATIAVFACIRPGSSIDNPIAACFACWRRMAM